MIYRHLHINFIFLLFFITASLFCDVHAQIRETIATDQDYILPKFPYTRTKKFERIYCNMYPDRFNCEGIGSSPRGMFTDDFILADKFFVKLVLRPVGSENYNALNVAGLYLRVKRPAKNDETFEYTFLDIELDSLTSRVYAHNDRLTAMHDSEVKFKLAYLALLEENLFLIDEKTYINELKACNNFIGPYYEASRKSVTDVLLRLKSIEINPQVLSEIDALLARIPDKYKQ